RAGWGAWRGACAGRVGRAQGDGWGGLRVEPLSVDGLRELAAAVGPGPPPGLVEWLGERTRGNPLFALALLQALAEEGGDPAAPSLRSLPEAVTARVASRVRRLGAPAVEVLERLAVMG